jgi:ribulose-phosphate 3-epimerase
MARDIIVSPSTLSADFRCLAAEIERLHETGCRYIHFDHMDGHFTEQVTYGPMVVKALRGLSDRVFDCHLMFTNPEQHFEYFAEAGADVIQFQYEVTDRHEEYLDRIHDLGCMASIVLNPDTPINDVEPFLPKCDTVMVMGVFPGYSGQEFITETVGRIAELREIIDSGGHTTKIEIDGGVNEETAADLIGAGADILVSGSFVFKHPDGPKAAVDFLRRTAASI